MFSLFLLQQIAKGVALTDLLDPAVLDVL